MTEKGFQRRGRRLVAECASIKLNDVKFSATEMTDSIGCPAFSYSFFRYKDGRIVGHVMVDVYIEDEFSKIKGVISKLKEGDLSVIKEL